MTWTSCPTAQAVPPAVSHGQGVEAGSPARALLHCLGQPGCWETVPSPIGLRGLPRDQPCDLGQVTASLDLGSLIRNMKVERFREMTYLILLVIARAFARNLGSWLGRWQLWGGSAPSHCPSSERFAEISARHKGQEAKDPLACLALILESPSKEGILPTEAHGGVLAFGPF